MAYVPRIMSFRHFLPLLLALTVCLSHLVAGAEAGRMKVTDYFLRLPEKYFEAPPAAWLRLLRSPGGGVYDPANGYLKCVGDGAQPSFEVALFRWRDDRPLLAVCSGELEGSDSKYLEFFELGPDGKMRLAKRAIFPVKDGNEGGNRTFELPRHGRTVVVREGGKVTHRLTWDGEKFAEEK